MNPRILPLLLAAASLLFAGCFPESVNPLSTPATSLIDQRLEGVYLAVDKSEAAKKERSYWHFHYRGTSDGAHGVRRSTTFLEILSVGHEPERGLDLDRYEALTTKIAGRDYLSFIRLPIDGTKKQPVLYGFARYEFGWRGDLRIWLADEVAFAAAIKAGRIRGQVFGTHTVTGVKLTDTTAHLAAFIAAGDPEKLFGGKPMVFHRLAP